MMSENDIDRLRCDPRCAKSDKPKFLGAIDIDSSPVDDDDAFSSATENAATETVAIAMDFNTDPIVPADDDDDDDDDDALVLVLAASRSLSSINSRVFSLDISSPHRVSGLPAANDGVIIIGSLTKTKVYVYSETQRTTETTNTPAGRGSSGAAAASSSSCCCVCPL